MGNRILLIDDEAALRVTLGDRLRNDGYDVVTAVDGSDGYQRALEQGFDLILLDILLPGMNGINVCRDLRRQGIITPIVMLSAKAETFDKVLGLKIGADDYITKPFQTDELLARIEASLRRAGMKAKTGERIHRFGPFCLDTRRAELTKNDQPIPISAKEFQLLRFLIEHPGEPFSREVLLSEVWGYNFISSSRTVDVHVTWLRKKLETNPKQAEWILTIRGLGYKFDGRRRRPLPAQEGPVVSATSS